MTMITAKKQRMILLPLLLGLFMVSAVILACTDRVYAVDVEYLDNDGFIRTAEGCESISEVQNYTLGAMDGKPRWYVVDSNFTFPVRMTLLGDVRLILKDGCKLDAIYGIRMATKATPGASLTIYAQSEGDGMGELIANASDEDSCAGIGGDKEEHGGIVVINGGKITANGGEYAAGIGGGDGYSVSNITINGGKVTAYGGNEAAGLGGGYNGIGGSIVINGGDVTAYGGEDYGAGIGGGRYKSGGDIIISGGTVTAQGGEYGAGIGGGDYGSGGSIRITGGKVTAKGVKEAAGIGGGDGGSSGSISISGGNVTANGGYEGAGIGGGDERYADTITITGGTIKATGGAGMNYSGGGAGIGGGENGDGGDITITGGKIEANGGDGFAYFGGAAAGIGGGEAANGGHITITGGDITANGGGNTRVLDRYSDGGAGIGGGADGGEGGTIRISGGVIRATGGSTSGVFDMAGSGGAGIGGGEGGSGGNITIEAGSVYAYGGASDWSGGGAGIGGGDGAGTGQTITITGGQIIARGDGHRGSLEHTATDGGAGIGGGDGSDGGKIVISLKSKSDFVDAGAIDLGMAVGSGQGGDNSQVILADDIRALKREDGRIERFVPVPKTSRDELCRGSRVKLTKCPHGQLTGCINLHESGHKRSCLHCYLENIDQSKPRQHVIDESSLMCACGYYGVLLSFRPGKEAQGSMSPEILTGNTVYQLPKPDFNISSHYTFAGWNIEGSIYAAGEGYTTPRADEEAATPVAVATWTQKDHEWGDWEVAIEATEEEEGVETRVCKLDPTHVDTRAIPKKKHVHDKVLTRVEGKPASCTESGRKEYYTCSGCSAIYADKNAETQTSSGEIRIPAKGHKAGKPVIDEESRTTATCSAVGGYNVFTRCTTCKAVLKVERIVIPFDTDAHAWGEWVVTKEATEDEEGLEVRTCKYDSSHKEERSIPKTKPEKITYIVKFKDGMGNTLATQHVDEGGAATAPADPTREGYTFNGWDTDFSIVTADLTVTARWKQNIVTHKVTFEDGLGKVLDTQTVVDGRPATAPKDPTRKGFVFSGWDTDFSSVTTDLTVKARWTEASSKADAYTVVFVIGFGYDPVSQEVSKGGSATAPAVPEVDGFTFTEWDKAFTNVTSNLTVTAQWKKNTAEKEHTVAFVDGYSGKPPISTQRVKDGQSAKPPADPTREGYTFDGWDTDFSCVTSNLTVIAQWKQGDATTVIVNSATVSAGALDAAVKKAGGSRDTVTTIVLGKKVKKISKGAFKNYKKTSTLVVQTKKLKKAKVKKSLKGSRITKVKVSVGKKKVNKKYVKKYKKIFTKKNAGKKVKVSL